MRAKRYMSLAAALVMLIPAPAGAQWFVQPFVGGPFGGAFGESLTGGGRDAVTQPLTIGATAGWTRGWLGAEADFGYAPRFFDDDEGFISKTALWTLMGNGRVEIPWGGTWRPYASAGAGMLRPNLSEPGGLTKVDDAIFGWNAGGGVSVSVAPQAALRGDVRYFRGTADEDDTNPFGIDFDGFDFWRASGGVVFTW